MVTGTASAPWEGECRRCLGEARGILSAPVSELLTDDPDPDTGYVLDGDFLDLLTIVHDACILELPLAPLCSADCLGLCPECGSNRNTAPCTCMPAGDPRWSALSGLAMTEGPDQAGRADGEPAP
ncbi:MAG TPA: DUF177 domain-containing protein [Acidimicrobiales bacterium]|nr:DUF177 domain-containing protein [Acidimicrobiales bacterium]